MASRDHRPPACGERDQRDTVLTGPQHASLPDDKRIEEAVAEAYRADIVCKSSIDPDEPRVTEEALRAGLAIGKWTDYAASSQRA